MGAKSRFKQFSVDRVEEDDIPFIEDVELVLCIIFPVLTVFRPGLVLFNTVEVVRSSFT